MMENQTIFNTGFVLAMIAGFAFLGVTDEAGTPVREPTHSCDIEETKAYCFDVRNRADKVNYRCLYDEDNLRRYFSCLSGWNEIPVEPEGSAEQRKSNSGESHCNYKGCF